MKGPELSVRVNEAIRVPEVRVINSDGKQLGVYPIRQAREFAESAGLDLVEINPKSRPPVCKIIDFGKFKYEQKKQMNESKKRQVVCKLKEVKLRPKTDEHDFDFKIGHIKRFLSEGHKAKVTIQMRGREMAHPEVAEWLMKRVIEAVGEEGVIDQPYRMDGRSMTMILAKS